MPVNEIPKKKNTETTLRLVLLGNGLVGKTSLLRRFAEDKFSESLLRTLHVDHLTKHVKVNGSNYKLHLYDTAGKKLLCFCLPWHLIYSYTLHIIALISKVKGSCHAGRSEMNFYHSNCIAV